MKHSVCLAFAALIAATAAAAPAFAADRHGYCRWYARTAVRQAEVADQVSSCRHFFRERPLRWHTNYGQHFRFCLSAFGSGANNEEYNARDAALKACGAL
jgi:hypothetical protein